jgi:4-amino-4-deoxy-L-arabinose transferase-like glycosyltransferase
MLRLGVWLWFAGIPIHIWDEGDYNAIATNLAHTREFALVAGSPTSLRPPLYPALVALTYAWAGNDNFQAVRVWQLGLSLITVVVVYGMAARLSGRRAAALAAGLVCFYPSLLGFNNLLLTEVLFTFLLCVFCTLLLTSLRMASLPFVAGAGIVLGLAALTRSVVWPFGIAVAAFLLVAWRGALLKRARAAAILLLVTGATLAPWAIRNTALERTPVVVDAMGGRNFMLGNYEFTPLYRMWDAVSLEGEQNWYSVLAASHRPEELETQGQIDHIAGSYGLAYVSSHPVQTLQRDVVKLFDLWGLERELIGGVDLGYFGSISRPGLLLLTAIIFGSYVAAMLLGIFGAIMAPPADRRARWFLFLLIGFICVIHVVTYGHSRYHLPLVPIVLVFAANALVQRRRLWEQRWTRSWWLASAVCGVLICGWSAQLLIIDAARFWSMLTPQ